MTADRSTQHVPAGRGRRARLRLRPRAVLRETLIVLLLGAVLTAASLGLLGLEYGGGLHFSTGDHLTAFAAGVVAAAVVRLNVRLHRRWKRTIGRFTAAAALCGLAAVVGTLAVMALPECPGGLFATGRCGVKESAAWGQVAGLAAVVNISLAGMALAVVRTVWSAVRDGSAQVVDWTRALHGRWRRPRTGRRGPQDPKGRPTPRRADAERLRRERLRART